MTDQTVAKPTETNEPEDGRKTFERRGLFAAAWAAVAALVLTKTTQPVEAAAGQQFQDTSAGGFVNNSAGGPSALFSNSGYTATSATFVGYAFQGSATAGLAGVSGSGSAIPPVSCGVYGTQNKTVSYAAGIVGDNINPTGFGVLGRSGSSATSLSDGVGVQGESAGGYGVLGLITASNKNAIAMFGENQSTYTGGAPGNGGFGLYGYSARGHGLVGATGTANGAAVVGATNGIAGAYAATFYGPVIVTGALTVLGPKSAAVPHPDGSRRLVYCVESPESWFEDFGKGQLDCGQAHVVIDPNFAAIANMDDYHVFVTVYDQHNDLMVSDRTPNGFHVQAKDDGGSAAFSWRIVAKRKDIVGERLAEITVPTEPQLPPRVAAQDQFVTSPPVASRRMTPQ